MSFHVIIPARYQSVRLPGKPLLQVAGKPIVQHVYERARESGAEQVVIATDDKRIEAAASEFGAPVIMTSAEHASGTDRLAEAVAALALDDTAVVVNLQGDEPLMPVPLIQQVADNLERYKERASIATLSEAMAVASDVFDPNIVKVVTDRDGFALYFSRAPIPWDRTNFPAQHATHHRVYRRHLGMYAYRADFLKAFSALAPSPLEQLEALEQLRALWHGYAIHVAPACEASERGVDTAADLERVKRLLEC